MSTPLRSARRPGQAALLALVLSLPTPALIPAPALAAPAVTCTAERDFDTDNGDIDGDGQSDPVVGMPNIGGIDAHLASGAQRVTESQVSGAPVGNFGTAVVTGYVNADACGDAVVTAAGTGGGPGRVYLVPGSDDGLVPAAAVAIDGPPGSGAGWAGALALVPGIRTLAVGDSRAGLSPDGGGAVFLYRLAEDGTPAAPVMITQDTPGVPGVSESMDLFGGSLAADGTLLAIGASGESLGTKADAGAVTLLAFSSPTTFTAGSYSQDSAGVPGTAETGDSFGQSLALLGVFLAVGVPDETVGSALQAGTVDLLQVTPVDAQGKVTLVRARAYHQNSARVPGTNETGDHWGFAVALGVQDEDIQVVVGAPYENVGSAVNAGSVTMFGVFCGCAGRSFAQGTTPVTGKAERNDEFGYSVVIHPGRDAEEDTTDSFVIGVPGEDVGTARNAGYAFLLRRPRFGATTVQPLVPVGGAPAGLAYGTVLGSPRVRG